MPASVLDVIVFPQPSAEICLFWQNTHRRTQPEKKTAPEPHVPDMHGSSHLCSAALATRSTCSIPSIPPSASPGIAYCSLQSRPFLHAQHIALYKAARFSCPCPPAFSSLFYHNLQNPLRSRRYFYSAILSAIILSGLRFHLCL